MNLLFLNLSLCVESLEHILIAMQLALEASILMSQIHVCLFQIINLIRIMLIRLVQRVICRLLLL